MAQNRHLPMSYWSPASYTPIEEHRIGSAMPPEIASRTETTIHIVKLIRFAIVISLGFAAVLLVIDVLSGGARAPEWRYLSEKVLITLVLGIAGEIVVAIAALTYLELRNGKPQA
jgi:hypothetical protein